MTMIWIGSKGNNPQVYDMEHCYWYGDLNIWNRFVQAFSSKTPYLEKGIDLFGTSIWFWYYLLFKGKAKMERF